MSNNEKLIDIENTPVIDVNLDVLNKEQFAVTTIYERKVQPYLEDITKMKSKNMTDKEMCKVLDISTTTFYQLRKLHTDLQIAYKTGIDMLVDDVESAAYKEAMGYNYTEDAIHPKIGTVKVTKYARGSSTMQKYILNNKRPKEYANKQTIATDNANVIDLTALKGATPLQIKQLIDEIGKNNQQSD